MKLTTSRIVDLAKALSKEAEQSETDSQIFVPTAASIIVELPSQLKRLGSPVTDTEISDSFVWQQEQTVAGAGGGATAEGPRLVNGLWRLRGRYIMQFTGTTNLVNASFARLQQQNAAGSVDFWLGRAFHVNGTTLSLWIDHLLSITTGDGNTYSLDLITGVTIAGDNLANSVSLIASRLL